MQIEEIKKQLMIDEGYRLEVYLDTMALPTFGIGHMITRRDPEFYSVNQAYPFLFNAAIDPEDKIEQFHQSKSKISISVQRVEQVFEQDLTNICADCKNVFPGFQNFPEEIQQILGNMMFNLGRSRFLEFKNLIKAIETKAYKEAAEAIIDSLWFRQVGDRGKRLVARLETLANTNPCHNA